MAASSNTNTKFYKNFKAAKGYWFLNFHGSELASSFFDEAEVENQISIPSKLISSPHKISLTAGINSMRMINLGLKSFPILEINLSSCRDDKCHNVILCRTSKPPRIYQGRQWQYFDINNFCPSSWIQILAYKLLFLSP